MIDDTIAAISTPLGEGGIGIVRISGPDAVRIATEIFKPAKDRDIKKENFKIIYGYIYNKDTNSADGKHEIIDEVLLSVMRAPNTYTREDVIEINCHGGSLPARVILELVLTKGARLAEPGEFTKRAFLNGRLDMAQAEAIIDVIRATTGDALKMAVGQLRGGLSRRIDSIQNKLLDITAFIEANIDFPEDEIEEYNLQKIRSSVLLIRDEVKKLIDTADTGRVYRDGLKTVIAGKPNVGKSSLLNVLLKEKRAIVTEIPGTTRDIIEEVLNIGGVPVRIIDTAGIRDTEDIIEKIGVERTKSAIEEAEMILIVFDSNAEYDHEDERIAKMVEKKRGIKVLNKIDLQDNINVHKEIREVLPDWPLIEISAIEEKGIEDLEKKIIEMVTGGKSIPKDGSMVSNIRHKNQLKKALRHLEDVLIAIDMGMPLDIIAIDIRGAWETVGEINGKVITENIIDKIFTEFCIGK
ncbi:tRNA uridine-5-carboxymethylaminomethyl(34) synthesis GTPase MnmE [Desulfotruncus alcoholivorax]|uniref:tRNA uridine-5-carboxymethylaminomethyl(34) synthesis GTPase MnmE n=1 Tax=Desulfotruncus alcoholivorax TaxID=265477 RepID=UPI000403C8DE|nr:tRNA uridine-5-carboxymethylaminomethyl(34) synthesis GTPase MnmE [Desulfotruncus alcoholivorax]